MQPKLATTGRYTRLRSARYGALRLALIGCAMAVARPIPGGAQEPQPQQSTPAIPSSTTGSSAATAAATTAGGTLHGVIKSGNIPLPGVAVTASNTLTGKKIATTTDITGTWSMTIPQNGRYVIRTEFAAFAASTHEALLNANSHDQTVNFDLTLASRAAQQQASEDAQGTTQQIQQAMRQIGAGGAQSLSLMSSLAAGTDAAEGGTTTNATSGAALPSAAASSTFSSDSVAVNGQSGTVSPLAGVDMDRIRDAMETARAQGLIPGGGGGFFGGPGFGGGGPGGPGGGFGGFGGGRGNFRGFRPDQPHGSILWNGNNSALNALPFAVSGQQETQPDYGSNQFTVALMSEPYIPKLTKPSGKDTVFLTLSGTRSSTPSDQYAVVPTADQRGTCLSTITASQSAACNLLTFFPLPNLTGSSQGYNYYFASTAQSNTTQAGLRYIRAIGSNAAFDGKVTDLSKESLGKELGRLKDFDQKLNATDTASLSPQAFYDFRILQSAIKDEIFNFEDMGSFNKNPMTYAGAIDVSIYIKRDFAPLEDRIKSIIAIEKNAPQVFAAAKN